MADVVDVAAATAFAVSSAWAAVLPLALMTRMVPVRLCTSTLSRKLLAATAGMDVRERPGEDGVAVGDHDLGPTPPRMEGGRTTHAWL